MAHFADVLTTTGEQPAVKGWRVLHACETVERTSALAEAQTGIGMNPHVLPRDFWSSIPQEPLSLMNAWHDVRDWRHALNDAEVLWKPQIVHAHSFASAMAGVRGSLPIVYDFVETLDEVASHRANSGAWLLRSFRVAEQFALGRASAVVAHSSGMKKIAQDRGAAESNVFVVPEPRSIERLPINREWAAEHGVDLGYDIVLFAAEDPLSMEAVLRAFATVQSEIESAVLLLEWSRPDRDVVAKLARELDILDSVRLVGRMERREAMGCADVVLVTAESDAAERANEAMLTGMASGKAVVAADIHENRECSEEGRGCVWFRAGDVMDLAQRASFVARNEDFARSLGESGRAHVELTRAPQVIARQYDDVYRQAASRRSDTLPKIPVPKIYALGTI